MEPLFGQMLSAWLEDTRLRVKRSTHATYRGGGVPCAPRSGGASAVIFDERAAGKVPGGLGKKAVPRHHAAGVLGGAGHDIHNA